MSRRITKAGDAGDEHDKTRRKDLRSLGLTPRMLAQVEEMRERQRASGLTPEEFARKMQDRAEAAQEAVYESKRGWMLPIIAGSVGAVTLSALWTTVRDGGPWAPLLGLIGTSVGVYYQFDSEHLPPRRRMVAGILIGAATAGAILLAANLG